MFSVSGGLPEADLADEAEATVGPVEGGQGRAGFVFSVDLDDAGVFSQTIKFVFTKRPVPVVEPNAVGIIDLVGTVEPVSEVVVGILHETEFNLMNTVDGQNGVDVVDNIEGSSVISLHPGGPPVGCVTVTTVVPEE